MGLFSRSLFIRLALRLTGLTVTLVLILLAFLAWQLNPLIDSLNDRTLTGQALDVAHYLETLDDVVVFRPSAALESTYRDAATNGSAGFAVLDADGRLIAASPGIEGPLDSQLADLPVGAQELFGLPELGSRPAMSGVALGLEVSGLAVVVQVSQSNDHDDLVLDTIFEEFVGEHSWIVLAFIALLLAITFATVRSTLRPVREASDLAARINPGEPSSRLPEENMPTEVVPLIKAVNRAFSRLQQGIEVQRAFTADAAHQLRTPLAVLNLQIDQVSDAALRGRLKTDIGLLNRIVAQLLHSAQAETLSLSHDARTDLVEVAREVATYLAPLAVKAGVALDLLGADQGPVFVHGHNEALNHAIRNLVENAIGHAPHGSAVEIIIERPATLRVIDHGPGIAPEHRALVLQRFWRADRSTGGAGLGLAIVAQIAAAHGATFEVGDAPRDARGHSGAMFSLKFLTFDQPS